MSGTGYNAEGQSPAAGRLAKKRAPGFERAPQLADHLFA
jgi:hypothetical protein